MNKIKMKNDQAHTTWLNKFVNKANLTEPALIPISWFTRIFGCRHKKLGTPFTRGDRTYNTCMICGASQRFDVNLWKSTGPFFYNPVLELYEFHSEKNHSNSKLVSSIDIDRCVEDDSQNAELSENKHERQE